MITYYGVFERMPEVHRPLLRKRGGPLLTPVITTRRLLLQLRYLEDFDSDANQLKLTLYRPSTDRFI
jgi:hypothetical protein